MNTTMRHIDDALTVLGYLPTCHYRDAGCTLHIEGDRYVMTHTGTGSTHSIAVAESDTFRVFAHWKGFIETHASPRYGAYIRPGTRSANPIQGRVRQADSRHGTVKYSSAATHYDDRIVYSNGERLGVIRGTVLPNALGYGIQSWSMCTDTPPAYIRRYSPELGCMIPYATS